MKTKRRAIIGVMLVLFLLIAIVVAAEVFAFVATNNAKPAVIQTTYAINRAEPASLSLHRARSMTPLHEQTAMAPWGVTLDVVHGTTLNARIVDYTLNSAIQKQGKTNHILIVAQGSYISLIVNNQILVSFTDTSYAKGSIAFFVANLPQSPPHAQAQFSQLNIYPIS